MSRVHIFCGPSLSAAEIRAIFGEDPVKILPPVAEGDIYRSVLEKPNVIAIIDGYFGNIPSVWHKEILFAMQQGIHVMGSSSMGALRAAELNAFGMQGYGRIYQDYASGILEDDDEVAVTHGPAEVGFAPLSEAMVNIRYTLSKALENQIICQNTYDNFIQLAKKQYYPRRNYELIIQELNQNNLPVNEIRKLQQWLPKEKIDQKKLDALEMIDIIKNILKKPLTTKSVSYYFEHTSFWEKSIKKA